MSSWKADSRYTNRCDDLPEDEWSDDSHHDSPYPASVVRSKREWVHRYSEELEELFFDLREVGQKLFGRAFLQFAHVSAFADFVYNHTQP